MKCRWLLRSAWCSQELLTTFETEIGEVAMAPGDQGEFTVWVDQHLIWDRREQSGFPDIKQLKQLVRDQIAPGLPLGHSDKPT